MASPKVIRPEDKGKVRVRFMEVELEGSNDTLLEGIRSITASMGRPAVVVRTISANATPRSLPSSAGTESESANEDEALFEPVEEAEESPVPPTQSARPRRPRSAPRPPEIDNSLRPDDDPMPLQEFCNSFKDDLTDLDRAVIVAAWLKEHRGIDGMTAPHFYTCCRFMDWSPPTDLTTPMRNLKHNKKMDSSERGVYHLTILGEKHLRELRA